MQEVMEKVEQGSLRRFWSKMKGGNRRGGGPQVPDRAESFLRKNPEIDITVHGEGSSKYKGARSPKLYRKNKRLSENGFSIMRRKISSEKHI